MPSVEGSTRSSRETGTGYAGFKCFVVHSLISFVEPLSLRQESSTANGVEQRAAEGASKQAPRCASPNPTQQMRGAGSDRWTTRPCEDSQAMANADWYRPGLLRNRMSNTNKTFHTGFHAYTGLAEKRGIRGGKMILERILIHRGNRAQRLSSVLVNDDGCSTQLKVRIWLAVRKALSCA